MAKFREGDIVKHTQSIARYIVTGINHCGGTTYWRGITKGGVTQGGTIMGSDNFEDYEVIGHFDIAPMYDAIEKAWHEDFYNRYGKECDWS